MKSQLINLMICILILTSQQILYLIRFAHHPPSEQQTYLPLSIHQDHSQRPCATQNAIITLQNILIHSLTSLSSQQDSRGQYHSSMPNHTPLCKANLFLARLVFAYACKEMTVQTCCLIFIAKGKAKRKQLHSSQGQGRYLNKLIWHKYFIVGYEEFSNNGKNQRDVLGTERYFVSAEINREILVTLPKTQNPQELKFMRIVSIFLGLGSQSASSKLINCTNRYSTLAFNMDQGVFHISFFRSFNQLARCISIVLVPIESYEVSFDSYFLIQSQPYQTHLIVFLLSNFLSMSLSIASHPLVPPLSALQHEVLVLNLQKRSNFQSHRIMENLVY